MITRCPSCHCLGHINPFTGKREYYIAGRPTAIHDCAFCDRIICKCCYVEHGKECHPEIYQPIRKIGSSCKGGKSSRRAKWRRSRSR